MNLHSSQKLNEMHMQTKWLKQKNEDHSLQLHKSTRWKPMI